MSVFKLQPLNADHEPLADPKMAEAFFEQERGYLLLTADFVTSKSAKFMRILLNDLFLMDTAISQGWPVNQVVIVKQRVFIADIDAVGG